MRILNIPGPANPKRGDRWFAACLQFAPDAHELFLRQTVTQRRKNRDKQWASFGKLDLTTGHWEQLCEFEHAESPLKAWSRDCSRIVTYVGDSHRDGDIIVVDDSQNILWETEGWLWRCIDLLETQATRGIVFSPDGRWLYAAEHAFIGPRRRTVSASINRADVHAHFAKPMETSKINPLTGQPGGFYSPTPMTRVAVLPEGVAVSVVEASPDGRSVVAGTTTGDTYLIRVRGGETLGVLKRKRGKRTENHAVRRISFRPSGKQLGVVVDGMVRVWDVKSAKLLWDAEDAKAHAIDLAYHPDGNTLAVARTDGAAVFLDAQTGAVRKRYAWKVGQLNSIAFSPDGLTCAAGGEKGQVVVWDVDA